MDLQPIGIDHDLFCWSFDLYLYLDCTFVIERTLKLEIIQRDIIVYRVDTERVIFNRNRNSMVFKRTYLVGCLGPRQRSC